MALKVLDLFSGIGGFTLGLERAGMETVAFCEIDPYARCVLRKHWPETPIYEEIEALSAEVLVRDGIACDVVCGGFPCTDISEAKRNPAGITGNDSRLWFEMQRLIKELLPKYVLIENSPRLRSLGLEEILRFFVTIGYDAEWHCLTAATFGAPHTRDRLFIISYPNGVAPLWPAITWEERPPWPSKPDVPRVAHGIPYQPHRRRLLGNSVLPQITETLGRAIVRQAA